MIHTIKKLFQSSRELLIFALPVIIGEVGQILFGVGDVLVAGRYSTEVLGALGTACGFFFPFLILGVGIMYAISPTKAKIIGEGGETRQFPYSSLILAIITGSVLAVLLGVLTFFLDDFSLQPELVPLIKIYLRITAVSLIPVLVFAALKENLLAFGKTIYPNSLIIIFNIVNILGNILLMIICDMGITGAALSTVITRTLMAVTLYTYTRNKLGMHGTVSWELLKRLTLMGIPIGLNNLMSGLIFCIVAVLAGQMSILDSAANNIVLNITSMMFMVPFALSSVAAVKISRAYGQGDYGQMRLYAWSAAFVATCFSSVVAVLMYYFPSSIAHLVTNDAEVIQHVTTIMFFVAIYQVPDALQIVILGTLRGVHIVKVPLIAGLVGIWAIGLPAACYCAYTMKMNAAGLWAGLALGLTVMAVALMYLFIKTFSPSAKLNPKEKTVS